MKRFLIIAAAVALVLVVAASAAGFVYWSHLQTTPQYSLAVLIEAAREDDQAAVDELVNSDAVVEGFVPQITDKAVELYGRGVPPEVITRAERVAAPLMPAIKDRARAELPRLIRRETERFSSVPFAAMVLGAERYLEITENGENAVVRSRLPQHSFEVTMRKNGTRWQVVGVRDDELALQIARTVGQQLIAIASGKAPADGSAPISVGELQELIDEAGEIFK